MTRHTPFIVVSSGVFGPTGYLYKLKDGEDPVYARYAEGTAKDMIELANELNYREAEKHNELAVSVEASPPEEVAVGIPTLIDNPSEAEKALLKIKTSIGHANAGRLNLVNFKRRIENVVTNYDESPRR